MKQLSLIIGLLFVSSLVAGAVYVRQHIETPGDRRAIAARLRDLGHRYESNPQDVAAHDEIRAVLNGKWGFAQTYACGVIRELGTKGSAFIPDLIRALNCGDQFTEREAARALGTAAVGDPQPVPALIQKLSEERRDVGWFSAEALGNIGAPAISAIPALKAAASSRSPTMVTKAKSALKKLESVSP